MSPEYLSSVAGIVLSLAFAYIPHLKDWYAAKDSVGKAQVMAVALIVVAVGAFGLACAQLADLINVAIACTTIGAVELAKNLIAALVANQAAYLLLVRPYKV